MEKITSKALYERARHLIPSGVNSPVRAFLSVHSTPFYVKSGNGAYLTDIDGNRYLDYVNSWGAIILGHADPGLTAVLRDAVAAGTSFGACHPDEITLAELITTAFPSIERVRLTSSGTEATMSAIRLARGYTGKAGIVKFRGCYHGHADSLLVKAGSGLATFGVPDSAGVPESIACNTYVAEYNKADTVWKILEKTPDIACVIIEPIMGNMGVIPPDDGFLKDIERMCRSRGVLLIFDEVITGFRVGYGGAQHLYGITPDLTCLGKIIGGGFPVGAFGGKGEIMDRLAPEGDIYQAGTLSGNPVAVKAGVYVLTYLKENPLVYRALSDNIEMIGHAVQEIARSFGIDYTINAVTGMFTGFFSGHPVTDAESAMSADRHMYEHFFKLMLEKGVFFAPSPFEASFLTSSHGKDEMDITIKAYEEVFAELKAYRR